MPIVRIVYKSLADDADILRQLHEGLQEIVASALSISEARLSKDDIELIFESGNPFNTGKDLKILIFANDFAERKKNIDERAEQISAGVKRLLSPTSTARALPAGFVYILLSEGGLGKF